MHFVALPRGHKFVSMQSNYRRSIIIGLKGTYFRPCILLIGEGHKQIATSHPFYLAACLQVCETQGTDLSALKGFRMHLFALFFKIKNSNLIVMDNTHRPGRERSHLLHAHILFYFSINCLELKYPSYRYIFRSPCY